ncbi:MAG TPA: ABC transporter ATP-binding protein [Thermofilum sp.]|nr:ABC transporter ATP-binding protein [Thermofilum sp.]
MNRIIEINEVRKRYRMNEVEIWALKGVNLEISKREFFGIVGPSGSGKSTLMYVIGGLMRPETGKVIIEGTDITRLDDDELSVFRHKNIGFVFQMYHLIPRMSALKNVMLPLKLRNVARKEAERKALEALKMVGMAHRANHRPSQMSGGEQQRVAIARAIVTEPKIILGDEPTGNVDRKSSIQIMELFKRLNKDLGVTIVMVTHNLELISYCDRAARMVDGRIVKIYSPNEYSKLIADMASGENV